MHDGTQPRKVNDVINIIINNNEEKATITKVNNNGETYDVKKNDGSIINVTEKQIKGNNIYTPSLGNKINSIIPNQSCLSPSKWVTNKKQCQVISDVNYCKKMDGDANNGCKLIQPDDQDRCGWCPSINKTIPMKIIGNLKQPKYTAADKYYPQDRNCNYDWKGFGYEKGPLLVDEECGKVNQCMGKKQITKMQLS